MPSLAIDAKSTILLIVGFSGATTDNSLYASGPSFYAGVMENRCSASGPATGEFLTSRIISGQREPAPPADAIAASSNTSNTGNK